MKRIIVSIAFAAALAAAAFAENMSLDVGGSLVAYDLTEANADLTYAADPFANFGYAMKLSNGMGLKLFLNADLIYRTFNGGDDTGTSAQINPGATLTSGDLTATLSLPQLINSPASDTEKFGSKAVDSKGIGYYAGKNFDEAFFSTAYAKVAYKIAASDALTVTPALETEIVFAPEAGLASLKPAVTVASGIVSADAKASVYLLPADYDADHDFYLYADPKVSVKLDSVAKGLAASLAASVPLTETEKLGSSLTPAVAYKLGALSVAFDLKFNKLFMDEDLGVDMQLEPKLKVSYGLKF